MRNGGVRVVNGEVGVLLYVYAAADAHKCYLVIQDENENYTGILHFDDARVCCEAFTKHLGRSIKKIGDLDVSFTL
jgi:hypothetical protein